MEIPDPDVNQLLKAFSLEQPDRVPYLDYWITSVEIIEHVLGRKARYMELSEQKQRQSSTLGAPIVPEDMVEFAQRIGMDAIGVTFVWRPGTVFRYASDGTQHYVDGDIKKWVDLEKMESPPDISEDLKNLERYLEAVEGTDIGIYPSVSSFFDGTYLAMGMQDFMLTLYDDRKFLETLMDIIWEYYSRVVEAVSQYDELSFVFINDDIAFKDGLMIRPEMVRELFIPRMERMLSPVKSKNKIITFHTDGNLDEAIPILLELGFSAVHPIDPPANNIYELKKQFGDKICLVGNINTNLLAYGTKEEIEKDVIEHINRLSPGGAYVVSSGNSIMQGIPPDNFLTFVNAVHKYGRY
jgi:uroporphyrinogen decarboxylase